MTQQTLITHRLQTNNVQTKTFEDREYYVIPTVAVKEKVLNGQFLPAEEISKHPESWNYTPVPVGHPEVNGVKVSAKNHEIIENNVVGHFYNAYYTNKKLKGEVWIDIEKAESLAENNDDIATTLDKIENNEPMEGSTAYFSDLESVKGTFNQDTYSGIQRNIKPDHFALLPNQTGACSLEDGCGIMVNHLEGGDEVDPNEIDDGDEVDCNDNDNLKDKVRNALATLTNYFSINNNRSDEQIIANMSHKDIRDKLKEVLRDKYPQGDYWLWIKTIDTENWCVFEVEPKDEGDIKLYKQSFAFDENGNIVLVGEVKEVIEKTVYNPAQNNNGENNNQGPQINEDENKNKEDDVTVKTNKKDLITEITNYDCNNFNTNELEEMDEDALQIISSGLAVNCEDDVKDGDQTSGNSEESGSESEEDNNSSKEPKANAQVDNDAVAKALEDKLGMSFDDIKANLNEIQNQKKQTRDQLINMLTSNASYEKDELEGIKPNTLRKMVSREKPATYAGQGGPRNHDLNLDTNTENNVPDYPGDIYANEDEEN